jgi:cell division protein FtsZ
MQGAKGVIISITGGDDMRLLEVDEAANHIRELVDPDANIIWGSAFNPDLEGRIRVSVVATGIEAQARPEGVAAPATAAPEPTRSFSFGMTRKPDEQPAGFRPAPVETVAAPTAPHQVAAPVDEPAAPPPVAAPEPDAAADDELVLGSDTMMPPAGPRVFGDEPPVSPSPAAQPAAEERRPWIAPGNEGAAPAQPRVKLGGTLFERMSNAARGAAREEGEGKDEPIDIPRFLHRQNNQ